MPDTRYERLPEVYRAHGLLLRLHLDLTLRCPLRCPHCYVAGQGDRDSEMSLAEIVRVLEEAKDLGVLFLLVSGGEPMLRPDFFEVLQAARRMHFHLQVKTTGLYLGRTEARRLARFAPIQVDLSIHGARAETHDAFVGMRGAFERAVAAFEALREAGVRVGVRTSLVGQNAGEAHEIEARFQVPGVDYRKGLLLFTRRDGTRTDVGLALDDEACTRILSRKGGRPDPPPPDPARPICGAGATALYVAPDGTVFPCSLWPEPLGNARKPGGLRAAFQSERAAQIRGLRNRDRSECLACTLRAWCPFCPGESVAEGLPPTAPNRVACRMALVAAGVRGEGEP